MGCIDRSKVLGITSNQVSRENSCPEPSERPQPCPPLDFGLPASRTVREYLFVIISHLFLWCLGLTAPEN